MASDFVDEHSFVIGYINQDRIYEMLWLFKKNNLLLVNKIVNIIL